MPDGEHLDRDAAVAALARISQAVQVPVTADIEGGYSRDLDGLAGVVRDVLAAGAVGINLEDAGADGTGRLLGVREQSARISAARQVAADAGVDRAEACRAAGADGVFVPGVVDVAVWRRAS